MRCALNVRVIVSLSIIPSKYNVRFLKFEESDFDFFVVRARNHEADVWLFTITYFQLCRHIPMYCSDHDNECMYVHSKLMYTTLR